MSLVSAIEHDGECPHALGDSAVCGPCLRRLTAKIRRLQKRLSIVRTFADEHDCCYGGSCGMYKIEELAK